MDPRLVRSMTVLQTASLADARAFYHRLGFATLGEWGEPPTTGIFQRGDVTFMIQQSGTASPAHSGTVAYIYTDNVDALYADFCEAGVKADGPPQDTYYGCRDFAVADPDGQRLVFGTDLNAAPYTNGLGPDRGKG